MDEWGDGLESILDMVNYHVTENNYELPYQFIKGEVIL
jgi:hypothetical protein